jgi:hypothetical protein
MLIVEDVSRIEPPTTAMYVPKRVTNDGTGWVMMASEIHEWNLPEG